MQNGLAGNVAFENRVEKIRRAVEHDVVLSGPVHGIPFELHRLAHCQDLEICGLYQKGHAWKLDDFRESGIGGNTHGLRRTEAHLRVPRPHGRTTAEDGETRQPIRRVEAHIRRSVRVEAGRCARCHHVRTRARDVAPRRVEADLSRLQLDGNVSGLRFRILVGFLDHENGIRFEQILRPVEKAHSGSRAAHRLDRVVAVEARANRRIDPLVGSRMTHLDVTVEVEKTSRIVRFMYFFDLGLAVDKNLEITVDAGAEQADRGKDQSVDRATLHGEPLDVDTRVRLIRVLPRHRLHY